MVVHCRAYPLSSDLVLEVSGANSTCFGVYILEPVVEVLDFNTMVCRVILLAVCVFDIGLEVSNLLVLCEAGSHGRGDVSNAIGDR